MTSITQSVYISLKGEWTEEGLAQAASAAEILFTCADHDGLGEPEIDDEGKAYAYDCEPNATQIATFIGAMMKAGPAAVLTLDTGDEMSVTTHVVGTLCGHRSIDRDISETMPVPLNRIDDDAYIAGLRDLVAIAAMPFTLAQATAELS